MLTDGLIGAGHDIVFLQRNRDLDEGGHDLRDAYRWEAGLPGIDALFLEWRWPIPGRSTTRCGSSGHTCDLHRQDELVDNLEAYRFRRRFYYAASVIPLSNLDSYSAGDR
jgi:hypothetical protein